MRYLSSFALLSTLVLSSLAGCASSADGEDSAEGANAALSAPLDDPNTAAAKAACTPAKYSEALGHYKKAEAAGKLRAKKDICDGGTQSVIIDEARAAVSACAPFANAFISSTYAIDVRDGLVNNLTYSEIVGYFSVNDAHGLPTWPGFADALPSSTFWGPAPGVPGNLSKLRFSVSTATLDVKQFDASGNFIGWDDKTDLPYKIGAIGADGAIEITITIDGKDRSYKLSHGLDADGKPTPHFRLIGATDDDYFDSLASECGS